MTETATGKRRIARLKDARSSSDVRTIACSSALLFRGQYLQTQMIVNQKVANANFWLESGGKSVMCDCNNCATTGGNPLYRLTNSLPYLLNRAGVRMGELFTRRIAGYDVTLPMYRVMAALKEKGDQRLGDLAFMTSIEISTLSRLIGAMKRKGLVSRKRLEDNARTVAINLTAKGKTLVEELIPIAMYFEEVAIRG